MFSATDSPLNSCEFSECYSTTHMANCPREKKRVTGADAHVHTRVRITVRLHSVWRGSSSRPEDPPCPHLTAPPATSPYHTLSCARAPRISLAKLDTDRFRLLFGLYPVLRARRGTVFFDETRDCDVIVCGWTDARTGAVARRSGHDQRALLVA